MNDFTKDELIEIIDYCNWEPPAPGHSDFRQNIWLKLQSMIDNYCEHDNECQHDWEVGFGSIHSPVTYCKKCYCQKTALPNDIFRTVMGVNK